ncbi:MAG: MaoC/PaaZ C-terminal domain-containing protein [Buchananella hordeovulneris]|nr:MaoC/PaaZ C-terminal domain-containing protein [Buchananella hordeovulneris]
MDNAVAGKYAPISYHVGAEHLAFFNTATARPWGKATPGMGEPAPVGGVGDDVPPAAPTFAAVVAQRAAAVLIADPELGVDFSRVLHGSESIVLHEPILAGDELTALPGVKRLVERGPLRTLASRTEVHGPRGLAAVVESTLAVMPPAPAAGAGEQGTAAGTAGPESAEGTAAPEGAQEAQHVAPWQASGQSLAEWSLTPPELEAVEVEGADFAFRVVLSLTDLVRYAGASRDFNPIHHNPAVAKGAGLPGVIAHGMLTLALVASAVESYAGCGKVKELRASFSGMVVVDPVQGAELLISGERGEGGKVTLNVTSGGKPVLSRASAVVAEG